MFAISFLKVLLGSQYQLSSFMKYTPPKTNMYPLYPKKEPFQKESALSATIFQETFVRFRECMTDTLPETNIFAPKNVGFQ